MIKTNNEVICGIYKIENKINHKKYIGQSIDIYDRWWHHKNIANRKDDPHHHNQCLYSAIDKYGIENFSFEIIEQCNFLQLDEREIYWISFYHSYIHDPDCQGYNMTKGGSAGSRKPVDQYDLNGNFIQTYSSITEAANKNKIDIQNLSKCLRYISKSAGGYQWRYYGDIPPGKYIKKSHQNSIGIGNEHAVNQYSLMGEYINTFNSIKEAKLALQKHTSSGHISECCAGKRKSAYGYIWKYANEDKESI